MNTENLQEGVGYLIVKVSTASGAIPLEDAAVFVRGEQEGTGIVYSLRSDRDGNTVRVELPAPALTANAPATGQRAFSSWSIEVRKEGYDDLYFQGVPIYSSIVSIQPAVMIPTAEGMSTRRSYFSVPPQEL